MSNWSESARQLDLRTKRRTFRHDLTTALFSLERMLQIPRRDFDVRLHNPFADEEVPSVVRSIVNDWSEKMSGRDAPLQTWQLEVRVPSDWAFPPEDLSDAPIVVTALEALALAAGESTVETSSWASNEPGPGEARSILRTLGIDERSFSDVEALALLQAAFRRRHALDSVALFAELAVQTLPGASVRLTAVERSWDPTRLGEGHNLLGRGATLGRLAPVAGAGLVVHLPADEAFYANHERIGGFLETLADMVLPAEIAIRLQWVRLPQVVLGSSPLGEGFISSVEGDNNP